MSNGIKSKRSGEDGQLDRQRDQHPRQDDQARGQILQSL
jgi:hypothetical protein